MDSTGPLIDSRTAHFPSPYRPTSSSSPTDLYTFAANNSALVVGNSHR